MNNCSSKGKKGKAQYELQMMTFHAQQPILMTDVSDAWTNGGDKFVVNNTSQKIIRSLIIQNSRICYNKTKRGKFHCLASTIIYINLILAFNEVSST